MKIKSGMLCVLVGDRIKVQHRGRVVETIRYAGPTITDCGFNAISDAWEVYPPWMPREIQYFASATNLLPISDPDIDTSEADDALTDSLLAVLSETRP